MTNEEYSNLKFKIVAGENNYFLLDMFVSTALGLLFMGIWAYLDLKNLAEMFILVWIASMTIGVARNPWRETKKELNRLFKAKASYEEAEKELGLKYEPPKNGIYLTPTPVYPAFFIIENVNIFPIVN